MLEVDGLSAWYGRAQVLFGVSFLVAEGSCVALLGRNGAGKSTTVESVMGLVPGIAGRVRFRGEELAGAPPHRIARAGIGWVPEQRRVFTGLTVAENLEVARRPAGPGVLPWTPERLYALFPNLGAMTDRPAGRMSGGEQQMLAVARTLMGNPRLVLLDEPTEGVAPIVVEEMVRAILALKAEGVSLLVSEQNLQVAGLVADRAVLLEKGEVRFDGAMRSLLDDAALQRAHLGMPDTTALAGNP
jgi:branched-chain amino acid transport system ATP-binding protein